MPGKLLCLCLLFLGCYPTEVDRENTPWRDLVTEGSLAQWEVLNGFAKFELWDGQIVGTSVLGSPNTFLVTKERYSDFILEFEVLVDNSLNSGVQFRSNSFAEYMAGRVHGYQCEIDPSDRAWSGGIYDEARRGWLYDLEGNQFGQKAFNRNNWNYYRIEAVGDTLRIWLNDVNTANLVDTVTSSGFIGLQVHSIQNEEDEGKEVRWKNLRILTDSIQQYCWRHKIEAPLKAHVPGQWPIHN